MHKMHCILIVRCIILMLKNMQALIDVCLLRISENLRNVVVCVSLCYTYIITGYSFLTWGKFLNIFILANSKLQKDCTGHLLCILSYLLQKFLSADSLSWETDLNKLSIVFFVLGLLGLIKGKSAKRLEQESECRILSYLSPAGSPGFGCVPHLKVMNYSSEGSLPWGLVTTFSLSLGELHLC